MLFNPLDPSMNNEEYEMHKRQCEYYGRDPLSFVEYCALVGRWRREYDKAWGFTGPNPDSPQLENWQSTQIDWQTIHELEYLMGV